MKDPRPYVCDVAGCNNRKAESNRWWLVRPIDPPVSSLNIIPWDDKQADKPGTFHACSEACSSKMLSAWQAKHVAAPAEEAVKV